MTALMELETTSEGLIRIDRAKHFVDVLFALDVDDWTDEHFQILERLVDRTIQQLAVVPTAEHRELLHRLMIAREGIEQGIAPNPAKRPSSEDMRLFVAKHLS